MLSLIRIEMKKAFSRLGIWIGIVICFATTIAFGLFLKADWSYQPDEQSEEARLREQLSQTVDWKDKYRVRMALNEYNVVVYGEDKIAIENSVLQYKIDNDLEPYKENTTWDFISYTFQLLNFLISAFAIIFITDIVSMEYIEKTIKNLYTRPYSRSQILLAKAITGIILTAILSLVMLICAYLTGGLLFTFKGTKVITAIYIFGKIMECTLLQEALLYFINAFVKALIMLFVALFIVVIAKNQIAPIIVSFVLLLFGNTVINKLIDHGVKVFNYSLFTNMDITNFINEPLKNENAALALPIVIMIHLLIFIIGSMIINQNSDI